MKVPTMEQVFWTALIAVAAVTLINQFGQARMIVSGARPLVGRTAAGG